MADERHDAVFVVGAVLGGVLGGAYALLNVPQSGAQTRAELAARWNGLTDQLAGAVAAVDEDVRRLAATAGDVAAPLTERLDRHRAETAAAVEVAEVEAVVTTESREPVVTLPDPLEPDPIVPDESTMDAASDAERRAADATDGRASELDVVIEGPRPADAQR